MHRKSKSNVVLLSRKIKNSVIERNIITKHKEAASGSPKKFETTQQKIDKFRTEKTGSFSYNIFYDSLRGNSNSKQNSPVRFLK